MEDESGRLGLVERGPLDAEPGERGPQRRGRHGVVGRDQEQGRPRRHAQRVGSLRVRGLDESRDGCRARRRGDEVEIPQLAHRERIAARDGVDALGLLRPEPTLVHPFGERGSRAPVETGQRQRRERREVRRDGLAVANRQEERRPIRGEAPRREQDRLGRGRVEPLRVVQEHDDSALLRHRGQQCEDPCADREAVQGARGRREGERLAQRVGLSLRNAVEAAQERAREAEQARERHVGLAAHATHARHAHVVSA